MIDGFEISAEKIPRKKIKNPLTNKNESVIINLSNERKREKKMIIYVLTALDNEAEYTEMNEIIGVFTSRKKQKRL